MHCSLTTALHCSVDFGLQTGRFFSMYLRLAAKVFELIPDLGTNFCACVCVCSGHSSVSSGPSNADTDTVFFMAMTLPTSMTMTRL